MVNRTITIGHLYPKQMNVYGDMGNIISLRYRLKERSIDCEYVQIHSLSQLKDVKVDILVGGGGQDSNQEIIQSDLRRGKNELNAKCVDGLVCLMVCGMYQLFGNTFTTEDGTIINGAGVIDLETVAGDNRMIGNVLIESSWGNLVGFENHSGQTTLGSSVERLGTVLKGAGNNGQDKTEGAVVNNVFGTYMHGPVLAKNPQFADELLMRALLKKYGEAELEHIDDSLELRASQIAARRPR